MDKPKNRITEKFYSLKVGETFSLKSKDGSDLGSFTRVPSGWIYRYLLRGSACCCFVPYTEDIQYWDIDLKIDHCHDCKSTNVLLKSSSDGWYVECENCKARSGYKDEATSTIKLWNR